MYLLSCLFRVLRCPGSRPADAQPPEQQNLLSSNASSLTSTFRQYTSTRSAVYHGLFHICLYYTLSIVGYSFVTKNHWSIVDSLYFGTVVFTTIGYGDLHPTTVTGEIWTMGLALYGIVLLGVFLGVLGASVVDAQHELLAKSQKEVQSEVLEAVAQDPNEIMIVSGNRSNNKKQQPSLMWEILTVIALETPIVCILIAIALSIGHAEGWSVFQRYVDVSELSVAMKINSTAFVIRFR